MEGGALIRQLRQARKQTLEELAAEASITSRALSDIERQRTRQPSRQHLQALIAALNTIMVIPQQEKVAIMVAFGYHGAITPPTEMEREQAARRWREQYRHINQPAYLVDFTQRMIDWNEYAPRILGIEHDDPRLKAFKGITIFDLAFNPIFIAASRIKNGNEFFIDMLKLIKSEMQDFQHEEWYHELIDKTSQDYPIFKEIWPVIPNRLPSISVRTMGPVHIRSAHNTILSFNLLGVDFADDPRFRVIQYHPTDSITISEWNRWIEEK